jgi:Domain of unknown function (DUF1924)
MKPDMKATLAVLILVCGASAGPTASFAGDAAAGAAAWTKEYPQADGSPARSCVTCHGRDLTKPGQHAVTNKVIEPMAPSVNPQRLTDQAKVEKWLLRNCRWTLGRECTPAEKADFISYIQTQ